MSGPRADEDWAAALDAGAHGAAWRCLSDLVDDPSWRARARAEFPEGADVAPDAVTRRAFLRLLSASVALGAAACTRAPREDILPYSVAPSDVVPGVARRYATSIVRDGYATGALVESHEGRPTKVEGHPDHPASLGAAGAFEQAHVLGLYDPSRRARSARAASRGRGATSRRCWSLRARRRRGAMRAARADLVSHRRRAHRARA
ncbi:MAG: TAT-variant-translocated molybdopterin oxidoreductase [Polyangiales bacterium]